MASRYAQFSETAQLLDSLSDDDLPEEQESDVDLEEVLAEMREYDIQEPRQDILQHKEVYSNQSGRADADPDSDLENAINQLKGNENYHDKSCSNCSNQRKVMNVSSFKKGQHILMPGQYSTIYVDLKRRLKRAYDHHAIIKDIKSTMGTCITMVLIHFTYNNGKIGVYEETKEFDLREKDISIVDYIFPRYKPDRIIARAESILSLRDKFKKYNLLTCNCEHFATWCVVGEGESFQVQSLRQKIMDVVARLFGAGSKIAKGILRLLFISSDEIAASLRMAVPELVLGGAGALYFIYCLLMTAFHFKNYKKGHICWSCLKGKLLDLWLTFGVFGATSAITFLLLHFAVAAIPGVAIPVLILLIFFSVAFQMAVPKLRKALSSPFTVDRVKVTSIEQIYIGDVISQHYHHINHAGIVTKVKITNDKQTEGYIGLVHYGSSGWFKTRRIVEEYFKINVETTDIYLLDCTPLSTFPADVVVSRARSRVGETKWSTFSNRSDHFSFWAKVQQYENIIFEDTCNDEIQGHLSRAEATLLIDKREIHHIEELQKGDVVKGTEIGTIDDTGILSSLRYLDSSDGRKFEIEVFKYDFCRNITRKTYTIDLNIVRLYVQIYNPALCQSMAQRLQNARNMEDEKGSWLTTKGFIRYCLEIKFKENMQVTSLGQICIGDVILQRFSFHGIKYKRHTSIVTEIEISNNDNTKGFLRLVHYCSSTLFGTRTIVEEKVEVDLEMSDLYLQDCKKPSFLPDVVVSRARSRVGETKWDMFSNRSHHFAYWAKYQQYENEIIDETCDIDVKKYCSTTEAPRFKEKREIHCIKDLKKGDVVQSDVIGKLDNIGILASVTSNSCDSSNKSKFEIEVYTYNFSWKVSRKKYTIDLKRDRLYVNVYEPMKYQCMEQRVLNAKKAEDHEGSWWTTEGFIEYCLGFKSGDRIAVTSLDQIDIGDVIFQRIYGIKYTTHASIVTGVKISNIKQTKGLICIIHYGSSPSFCTKEIIEENVEVDLEKSKIYLLDCKRSSNSADVVVNRARCRIGETKWNMFSNRSHHFAYWAKFQKYENVSRDDAYDGDFRISSARTEVTQFKKQREIHHEKDLRKGDVVKSNVIGIIDTGILTTVKSLDGSIGRKFEIEVYKYNFSWTVTRTKYTIDLKKDNLYVQVYNPLNCQAMDQRLQNAQCLEDLKGWWWTTEGFIDHCIKIKSSEEGKVTRLDQIGVGDVISQRSHESLYPNHMNHKRIVTEVRNINRQNTKGCIRFVHYGYSDLTGKRKVVEEELEVDIDKSSIYLVDYKTPSFPPGDVVRRAKSRIGETKWDIISNRSDHLANWAKCRQNKDETFRLRKQREVHHMNDLQKGDVVTSRVFGEIGNTGILSSMRYLDDSKTRTFEIEVFTYTFSRRITRRNYTIDLNKDRLYVKCYDPEKCTSFERRLQNARDKEEKICSWWTTAGFIENCLEIKSGDNRKVTRLDQIDIGDIIYQRFHGIKYTSQMGIVTDVNINNEDKTKGCIHLIHYISSALFGTKHIIEEKVDVDIEMENLYIQDCKTSSFPPNQVVCRARSRIGESQRDMFSKSSIHFAYWAKYQQYEENIVDEDFIKSTSRLDVPFFLQEREIHRIHDLTVGDVVKSNVIGIIDNTGILSSIKYLECPDDRKFEIEVFTYSFWWRVTRTKINIDLNENRLFVKVYNPSKCQAMEQRVQNARDKENKLGKWLTTEGFIRHCIELKSQ
ncbi:uncharacterized protein LOC127711155 [Mytilus californianus]|uniref:uncharacterized protein LOC127711155 n=1 Tax=Mytilus californianus TaxID=6549 RepID=UPI00224639AB|nr:uncharacterized protein LOC127711155 [Mytilus californianus]